MSFGSRLKEKRESLNITQPQLAEMLGVSKGAIFSTLFRRKRIGVNYRIGFLVKYIICQCKLFVKRKNRPCVNAPDRSHTRILSINEYPKLYGNAL